MLTDVGFSRAADGRPGLTDDQSADMFAWLCLTGLVHLVAGAMTLPVVLYGWENVGPIGHLIFFTGTWLAVGWILFDGVDSSLRCWGQSIAPAGISGMDCPCPPRLWALMIVMHHPFWLMLVLPMNELLCDLGAYHLLICAQVLGAGLQYTLRQVALVLSTMGKGTRKAHRAALAIHAGVVVVCRGALFFPLGLDVTGKLLMIEDAEYVQYARASSSALVLPGLFMGLFNVVAIMDAIKSAMWCAQSKAPALGAQQEQPLRTESGCCHSDARDGDTSSRDDDSSQNGEAGLGTSKPKKAKGGKSSKRSSKKGREERRPRDAADIIDPDEEMTFGFNASEQPRTEHHIDFEDDDEIDPEAGDLDGQPSLRSQARAKKQKAQKDAERARLRREMEEARREMDRRQREAAARPMGGARVVREPAPRMVDHSIIFSTGVVPKKTTHYAMLGVSKSASDEEIKKAFRSLSMKWHPDKNPSDVAKAEIVFMGIKDAYECLIDPTRRKRYDKTI